jgi:hypothetical protein
MGDRACHHGSRGRTRDPVDAGTRGALIRATAAYGLALALRADRPMQICMRRGRSYSRRVRPPSICAGRSIVASAWWRRAAAIARRSRVARSRRHRGRGCQDESCGQRARPTPDRRLARDKGHVQILTHCNAGALPHSRLARRQHPSISPTKRAFHCMCGSARRAHAFGSAVDRMGIGRAGCAARVNRGCRRGRADAARPGRYRPRRR